MLDPAEEHEQKIHEFSELFEKVKSLSPSSIKRSVLMADLISLAIEVNTVLGVWVENPETKQVFWTSIGRPELIKVFKRLEDNDPRPFIIRTRDGKNFFRFSVQDIHFRRFVPDSRPEGLAIFAEPLFEEWKSQRDLNTAVRSNLNFLDAAIGSHVPETETFKFRENSKFRLELHFLAFIGNRLDQNTKPKQED